MQEYYKSMGLKIRALRKEKGLNQAELATLLGKSLRTLQKYEKGEIEISLPNIHDLAEKLDTTPTYLLGYQSETTPITNFLQVIQTLFELEQTDELGFHIEVKRPPAHEEWECSLVFDGKDRNNDMNTDLCLFLEDWMLQREKEDVNNPSKQYMQWKERMLAYTLTSETLKAERLANEKKNEKAPLHCQQT